jgi:hypothetical protein
MANIRAATLVCAAPDATTPLRWDEYLPVPFRTESPNAVCGRTLRDDGSHCHTGARFVSPPSKPA